MCQNTYLQVRLFNQYFPDFHLRTVVFGKHASYTLLMMGVDFLNQKQIIHVCHVVRRIKKDMAFPLAHNHIKNEVGQKILIFKA